VYEDPNNPIAGNRYGYNGNYLPNGSGIAGLTVGNPLALNAIVDTYDHNIRMLGGLYGELEILRGLKFRSAASMDFNVDRGRAWNPDYSLQEAGLARVSENFDSRGEGYTQVFTNTLTYGKTFGDHTFNALAGIEYQKIRSTSLSYNSSNYLSNSPDFYSVVGNGQGPDAGFNNAGGGANDMAYLGYLGRLSYDYKQKYLLTASFRRDGTGNFAPDRRYGNFPAVSAAWRISEEPFFKVPFISELKLRGSWGRMGNSGNSGYFPYISGVTTNPNYGLGKPNRSVQVAAPRPGVLTNPLITWETVETTDFGFDVSLFNNKLSLLATYYFRNTKDFLFGLPVARTAGFAPESVGAPTLGTPSINVNLGSVTNQGVELELSYQTNLTKDLSINISGNFTTVKNRLAELAPNIQEYSASDYRTAVGYPIGYFYGYRMIGIYQNADEAAGALPDNQSNNRPRAGDIIFEDNNSEASADDRKRGQQYSGIPNDTITPADRTYLGKTIPDFFYGITVGGQFKGFDLSALFAGVSGVQLYNNFRSGNEGMAGYGRNMMATTQNRWTGEGTSNTMPRAIAGDPYNNNRFSSRWIEDAGFFRLRNVQLGYTLPAALLSKTKVFASARVYIAGSNLFVVTKYTGLDPEVQTPGSEARQTESGSDVGNMPQPRTFQGGIQLQF
jgi:TonB-linked SusC/RagA family outer membrane protein